MKVKLRIESPNKAVNEIDKNINSVIGLIATSISEEILSDDTVNEIMDCIKSNAEYNIANIRKIVKEQKADYENDIIDLHGHYEHKIRTLEDYYENKIKVLKTLNESLKDNVEDYMY